jgi:hypothetical protein
MPIIAGQTALASDFIDSSAGAGDEGKVPKLNASGKLDQTFTTSPIVRTYTTSGSPHTWTKPTGLKYIIVEVQGSGANGGNASGTGSSDNSGDGGASGGYARKLIAVASLGATETITIGAGNGTTNTTFGSHCTGGYASGITKGIGSSGDINIDGQYGFPAYSQDSDGDTRIGGQGGDSRFGWGGRSRQGDRNGIGYGSGGAGGYPLSLETGGGSGTSGFCTVTEYYN